MDDKEIFEKYCVKHGFNSDFTTEKEKKIIKNSYSYIGFELNIATNELKQSILDCLPKWMRGQNDQIGKDK